MRYDSAMSGNVRVSSVRVPLNEVLDSNCRAIFEYWDRCRAESFAPTWRGFELMDLPPDCIRYTHVVDIHDGSFDITFRFWGTGLTDILHFDRTGESLLTTTMGYLYEARRQSVLSDYQTVIDTMMPLPFLWDASFAREHASHVAVPSIRLPISNDGKRVTQIATHFDFTDKRDTWQMLFRAHSPDWN